MTFLCTVTHCSFPSSDQCTYPEVVGELQGEDGDALIVERACDGAGDIARHDGDEAGRQEPCTLVPQLPRQQEGGDGCQTAEHRCQKDTHVTDVDSDVEQVEHVVDEAGSHHQPRVYLSEGAEREVEQNKGWEGCWGQNATPE